MDFSRRTIEEKQPDGTAKKRIYFANTELGSYSSIIEDSASNGIKVKQKGGSVPSALNSTISDAQYKRILSLYYTALGRERFGISRSNYHFGNVQEILAP